MTGAAAPRVAVVGVRRVRQGIGLHLARHLVAAGARVPAFLGRSGESAAQGRELLARAGIDARGFTSLRELLAAAPVDALAIASPARSHAAWLRRAARAGLHVLCEKPFVWGGRDPAGAADAILAEFAARRLVVRENCQWPETLPAFDELHPGVRARTPAVFAMWLSPASRGAAMLADSMSHPLSLLQAIAGADGGEVEDVWFSTRSPRTRKLDIAFMYSAGTARIRAAVSLRTVAEQPRPAGFGVDGHAAHRRVRLDGYAQSFEDGGARVAVPDPTAALVARFVETLRSGEPEAQARRERDRVAARMRMLARIAAEFGRRG